MYQNIVLPILVIAIGLISIVGRVSGNSQLERLGYVYAASPLPIPFTDPRGLQEAFVHTYKVVTAGVDGSGDVVTELAHMPFSGPHKRVIAFIQAFIFSSRDHALINDVLEYGLCSDHRPLLKAIHLEKTEKIVIEVESNTKGLAGTWKHTVLCKN